MRKYSHTIYGYLFLMLLSLMLGSMLFFSVRRMMATQLNEFSEKTTENFQTRAESMMREMEMVSHIMMQDDFLLENMRQSELPSFPRLKVCQTLQKYGTQSEYINEIYIISPHQQYIFSSNGGYAYQALHSVLSRIGETEASLRLSLAENASSTWKAVHLNQTAPYILQTLQYGEDEGERAILIITLRMTEFLQLLHHMDAEMCALYNEGCVISTIPMEENAVADWTDSQASNMLGKSVHLVRSQSDLFTYLVAIETEHYDRPQRLILFGFFVYFSLMAAFGVLCAVLAGRHQYKNISNLAAAVSSQAVDKNASYQDLQTYIHTSLTDYDSKLKLDQVRKNEEKLIAVLRGNAKEEEAIAEALTAYQVPLDAGSYYVISCYVKASYGNTKLLGLAKSKFVAARMSFDSTLKELTVNQPIRFAGGVMTGVYSAVLAVEDNDWPEEKLEWLAESITQRQETVFGIHCQVMISRKVASIHFLSAAFRETEQMHQIIQIMGADAKLLSYRYLDQQVVLNWDFLRQVNILTNQLLAGRFEEIPEQVAAILAEHVSHSNALSLIKNRIDILSHILYEAVLTTNMRDFNYDTGPQSLTLASTADELLNATNEIFGQLSHLSKNGNNDDIVSRTCAYIQQNLQDVNLNVTMLCDAACVSAQHLSRMFKKQMNQTLMEYVNMLRIDRAKELLTDTDLTVAAIAEKTGYGNVKTFLRNFQSMVGMTPSAFRKAKQQ